MCIYFKLEIRNLHASVELNTIIKKRWEKMYHPVMEVAYLLDPKFVGRFLPPSSIMIVSEFISKYYPSNSAIIWNQLVRYKARDGVFSSPLIWDSQSLSELTPTTWWKGNFSSVAYDLCQMAIRVLTIPTSSAASERNWSTFAYIHDKKRNRLIPEHVLKLVYIYTNYRYLAINYLNSNLELLTSFQETVNNNDKNYVILEPNQKYNESNQEHEETTLLFESDDELINLDESEDENYE